MPKAMRNCGSCGALNHVRRAVCECGQAFPKKGAAPIVQTSKAVNAAPKSATVTVAPKRAADPTPDSSSAYTAPQLDRIKELQNHIADLERAMEKRDKVWEAKIEQITVQYKKFYASQGQLLWQRAFEYFGGKGDLYYSKEHGDNPKLFKAQSDETGVFIPPALPDRSSEVLGESGELTDEMIKKTAEVMLTHRAPQERDLKGDGVIIDDVMSFSYAVPVEVETEAPTVANAVDHVKFLIGEAQ